jgi:SpoVK/Ycf46/Vps4 family AAA+-type ATPase
MAPSAPLKRSDVTVIDNDPHSWSYTIEEKKVSDTGRKEYACTSRKSFVENEKLYGRTNQYAARIIQSYKACRTHSNLGVLMVGEKGTGKTSLAQKISILAREQLSLPTFVVGGGYSGPDFNTFIASLPDGVILFDEFEKLYNRWEQEALLSIFQGFGDSGKLMLLTANEQHQIHPMFISRPGRIRYRIVYNGLTEEEIREYAEDNLIDIGRLDEIVTFGAQVKAFTYDQLSAIVAEVNQYPEESLEEITEILNVVRGENTRHAISAKRDGTVMQVSPDYLYGDPNRYANLVLDVRGEYDPATGEAEAHVLEIATKDFKFDPKTKVYTYFDPETSVIVTLSMPDSQNYGSAPSPRLSSPRRARANPSSQPFASVPGPIVMP